MTSYNYVVSWTDLINQVSSLYLDIFILILMLILPFLIYIFRPSRETIIISLYLSIIGWIFSHLWIGRIIIKIGMLTEVISNTIISVSLQSLLLYVTSFASVINIIYGYIIIIWGILWVLTFLPEIRKKQ